MGKWKSEVENQFGKALLCDKKIDVDKLPLRQLIITKEKADFYFEFSNTKTIDDCLSDIDRITRDIMDFMEMAWDVSFSQPREKNPISYFREEGNKWEEEYQPISVSASFFSIIPRLTEKEIQNLTEYVMDANENKVPLGFLLLKECKTIKDSRSCFISIINACEIGIKEFYSLEMPDTRLLLNRMPSPPLDVLLCKDVFSQYFDFEIPNTLISKLKKSVKKRDKLVHSNKEAPTETETASCYHTVLQILNLLNKKAHPSLYRELYGEEMHYKPLGERLGKIEMSKPLEHAVERGEVDAVLSVTVQNVKK